ncbi:predicted protein [Sclerotinia sclerotiorum 1980 UF-70]|uniref:Uncharacterized protein n=1 Tax=Sclerotinia sclerotiorum (strain ATCC 18683 / 1980 / Ss-1) TaxID=665079 RepID=A7EU88_SCLS1|nr:predicted protein [Sclerotinia sclerotiorum 1980 UF-70]EDN93030.1 predicted protein [Sclerotinia sclerotiorum 1980 UF-70]
MDNSTRSNDVISIIQRPLLRLTSTLGAKSYDGNTSFAACSHPDFSDQQIASRL